FLHPADGSVVRTGALSSSVSSRSTGTAGAQAVSDVLGVTLFNGEITAESVAARAKASALGADAAGSSVTNLVVLGTQVAATPNLRLPLADWGYLIVLEQVAEAPVANATTNARGAVNALHVVLTADHAGLPAGAEILVGHAEAAASTKVVAEPAPPATPPAAKPVKPGRPAGVPPKTRKPLPKPREPDVLPGKPGSLFRIPPDVSAPLSPDGYVFPVYGVSSFADTFRAARAGVGWHHGEDIFAPLGAPLLAVADGTVFSVGWNDRGGYRLWLRDRQGNQFYYAHLSAFSPLAVDGNEVKAGDVIGFLGNTGDAQTTPYHLHFEIHPVGLLPFGYDGVVNPYAYLSAWRRLQDISFAAGRGWAPPVPSNATAPRPAAVLLGSTDISSASGLEPGSLERALAAPVLSEG
ncbi:MAG: choice-of-anchor P family protein, partial [Gaiellaceae bacterium]